MEGRAGGRPRSNPPLTALPKHRHTQRPRPAQFGLGFIREINEPHVGDKPSGQGIGAFTSPYELQGDDNFNPRLLHPDHKTLKEDQSLLVSEMGHASAVAVDVKQQVFLLVYVSLGTLSIVDVCAAVANLVEAEASDGDDFHPVSADTTLQYTPHP